MIDETPHETVLLDAHGTPARKAKDTACPQCRADAKKRVKSGMGDPHPVCSQCGHEFHGEPWHG